MSNFQEEFEAWCAGDQSETFEYHWDSRTDHQKDLDGFVKSYKRSKPKVTLWQRFWRSPWTWLLIAAVYWYAAIHHHGGIVSGIALWFLAIISTCNFLEKADKRWGRP